MAKPHCQWLWVVMNLICLNTVMFVRMLLSILLFHHHLHLYPMQAALAETLCLDSFLPPPRVLATTWSTVCRWKTESWKVRDLLLAMHPSFSLTPRLSCCSVVALPMMAPARDIYWKADNQLKWHACLKVSDLQWDSKDEKNVNQLRIFMFDTCCYDN